MKEFVKKPSLYLYLLFVLCVYYTNEAFKIGIYHNLIDFADTYRVLYKANINYSKGGIGFGTLISKYWTEAIWPGLPYILSASLLIGLIVFLVKVKPKLWKKIFKILVSVKLAVFFILLLALLSAIGTFVESNFNDAEAANKLVYHSIWMYGVLGSICIQLICVMIDRWPWKPHHSGFVLAHIGILILLYGSVLTHYFGIDGSMVFRFNESSQFVSINSTDIFIYSSFDGKGYTRLAQRDVDFIVDPPTEKAPYVIPISRDKTVRVIDFFPYAYREATIVGTEVKSAPPAIRFQLEGSRASMSNWLVMERNKTVSQIRQGPLTLTLNTGKEYFFGRENEILLEPDDQKPERVRYKIFSSRLKKVTGKGFLKVGDVVPTGFMDFQLRIINFFQHHEEKVNYKKADRKSELTNAAILVDLNGQTQWMGLNSLLRFYIDDAMYLVSYGNKRLTLDFKFKLKDFKVGRYQGTNQPASYESDVIFPDGQEVNISMNEPMKKSGFTFYQSSFQQDEAGNPTASILSVNRDPGRVLKYLGSLIIFSGFIMLFYFRSYFKKARSPQ